MLALCLSCGSHAKPSEVEGAPRVPPDESYYLGAVGWQQGFLWHCEKGERVHLFRSCGEMVGCGAWALGRGPCGAAVSGEPRITERRPMTHYRWQ